MKLLNKILCFCLLVPTIGFAGEAEIKKSLSNAMPGLGFNSVEKSEIKGLYRVETSGGETLFASEDGAFFVTGDLYSVGKGRLENLTEVRRVSLRAEQLSAISENEKIIFPAKGETKARVAVFTDIDCGYCRKLHKEVPALNEMGVEVSYLAYPRAGIGSDSYEKFVSAWCSDDKQGAMTLAKSGKSIPAKTCKNPIANQFQLGQSMGVTGTPAILLENGQLIPGYLPADKLGRKLGVL